ncbi:MAG TPA: STAS-like domain-containing protein [Pyrinomonadaceae bacterium]|nr:STAS-like domain-containing protein [Pyrinomonadaceae bacterium]
MNRGVELSVYEIVGSPLCVASEDGQKVYDRIAATIREDRSVSLSFRNINSLTSAFLNAAIGQLYGSFGEDEIRSKLRVHDMEPDDRALLKRVVDTAKEYFKDPHRFEEAVQNVLGEGAIEK